ncbi:hypothetical protein GOV12_07275 [Candidatus Pacearchaeota archaeon]|nr:hypothetical protein [Candidatus Pacearchaeota archaeon]
MYDKINNDMINKKIFGLVFFFLVLTINLGLVNSAAIFQVSSFSCSPSENVINSVFSCTSQISNVGDSAGTFSTATLYPDSNDWLEDSNYPQSAGTSVSPGQSTEITFSGLKAIKSGKYGFSKIMLDSVTDTYVSDNNIKVNIIDVALSVSNSASSAAMEGEITSSVEVTAGGNIDVILTLSVSSGGCNIGSQSSQKSISGMQNGNKQSRSWTVTQGTTGDCIFTISAAATGEGGVASKTNEVPKTITCTDCPTGGNGDPGGSSGSGGAGGGGGVGTTVKNLGELNAIQTVELSSNENVKFNISGTTHFVSITNLTETNAIVIVESEKQEFFMTIGDEKNVDLDSDEIADISIKLKSINFLTKKATIIITPLKDGVVADGSGDSGKTGDTPSSDGGNNEIPEIEKGNKIFDSNLYLYIIIFFVICIVIVLGYLFLRKKEIVKNKKIRIIIFSSVVIVILIFGLFIGFNNNLTGKVISETETSSEIINEVSTPEVVIDDVRVVSDTTSCEDSDNGLNYITKGVTKYCENNKCLEYLDDCESTFLTEWYCDGKELGVEKYHKCKFGCFKGVCRNTSTGGGSFGGGGSSGSSTPSAPAPAVIDFETYILGDLVGVSVVEIKNNDRLNFNILEDLISTSYSLILDELSMTSASLSIDSPLQEFSLQIGEEKSIDLDGDLINDILLKLKSVSLVTNRARFQITRI